MKTYWNTNKGIHMLNEWEPNCWTQITCPTEEECLNLQEEFHIPDYFFSDIADADERARYEYDDGWMLVILRIPYVKEIRSRTPYTTVPLGIIHKRDVTITVCFFETNDDRLCQLSATSWRRLRRLCGYDIPYVPLQFDMVSETSQANQYPYRQSKA